MSIRKSESLAFGVEPGHAPYRLRQARYYEIGTDVGQFALQRQQESGGKVDLLDVGTFDGVSRRYIEAQPGGEHVNYHAVDIYPYGQEFVYKHDDWTHHHIDLCDGLRGLESNRYDIVICEQVLEHLHDFQPALADLSRVLAPGGLLIVGVPTFPHGLHLVRKHAVPFFDRLMKLQRVRGHVQAFSKTSFVQDVKRLCPDVDLLNVRGFRIVSGGLLGPLENYRWWWRYNRWMGSLLPSLCIEVQVLLTKPHDQASNRTDVSAPSRRAA